MGLREERRERMGLDDPDLAPVVQPKKSERPTIRLSEEESKDFDERLGEMNIRRLIHARELVAQAEDEGQKAADVIWDEMAVRFDYASSVSLREAGFMMRFNRLEHKIMLMTKEEKEKEDRDDHPLSFLFK